MLTLIYRWAVRFRRQDEVTADMLQTFEEARDEAKAQGMRAYLAFACREILGLAGAPSGKARRWPRILAWSLAGLAAGVGATYVFPAQYTSDALLRVSAPFISEHPHAGDVGSHVDEVLSSTVILSRFTLMAIVEKFDLYPGSRRRQPLEKVLNRMRRDIRIERAGGSSILVSFTYGDSATCSDNCDRYLAQRVTQDLLSRLIDDLTRNQSNRAFQTTRYFEESSLEVAKRWEKLNAELHQTSTTDPRLERLALDRDLARKEYESLREKASEAQRMEILESHKMGRTIFLMDPASLPMLPDTSIYLIYGIGLGCGFILGVILALIRTIRGTTSLILPQTSEG